MSREVNNDWLFGRVDGYSQVVAASPCDCTVSRSQKATSSRKQIYGIPRPDVGFSDKRALLYRVYALHPQLPYTVHDRGDEGQPAERRRVEQS